MMRRYSKPPNQAHGFTLVEIMVTVSILALLLIFIARLMNSATSIATLGGKKTESDNQARLIFDRLANDFGGIIRRADADYIFAKSTGNDTMYFFSEASAYFDSTVSDAAKNRVALVGYRINSSYQLERLSQGLTWDGTFSSSTAPGSVVFLTPSGGSTPLAGSTIAGNWASVIGAAPSYSNGSSVNYHVVGDQVYRMELSFLQTNGTIVNTATPYNGLQNVSAISVALGLLDTASRTILQQNGQIPAATGNQMLSALPDAVIGTSTLQTWKSSNYLNGSGVPASIAGQLRIYERTFYVNN